MKRLPIFIVLFSLWPATLFAQRSDFFNIDFAKADSVAALVSQTLAERSPVSILPMASRADPKLKSNAEGDYFIEHIFTKKGLYEVTVHINWKACVEYWVVVK